MTGFEPWTSSIGSDCSTNCATTTALHLLILVNVVGRSQCDQIGRFFKVLVDEFSFKSSPNKE